MGVAAYICVHLEMCACVHISVRNNIGGVMLSQIDALLETLTSEEKQLLKRKSYNGFNRRRKPFIGNKERGKRKTRNIAWTFLSEYYGIIFHAPMRDQMSPLITERKRGNILSPNEQPFPKKLCANVETSFPHNGKEPHVEEKNSGWLRNISDDTSVPSFSSKPGLSMKDSDERVEASLSPRAGNVLMTAPRPDDCVTGHQDPCLLMGLCELFEHKRDLFDKLCTELNI